MSLEDELRRWEEQTLAPVLKKFPERKPEFNTSSGIPLPRVAMPGEGDYLEDNGFPGDYPFTRGIQPSMYRGRLWRYAGAF